MTTECLIFAAQSFRQSLGKHGPQKVTSALGCNYPIGPLVGDPRKPDKGPIRQPARWRSKSFVCLPRDEENKSNTEIPYRPPAQMGGRSRYLGHVNGIGQVVHGVKVSDSQAAEVVRGKDFIQLKNGPFDLDLVFAPDETLL